MSTPRRAVVLGGELVAPGVRRVHLRVLDAAALGHRAGQYVLLHARDGDGAIVKRAYSIATPPSVGPSFELCVRRIPTRSASEFVHALERGTEVPFTGPWGKFVVDDDEYDLTLVATGTGISCVGGIVEDELRHPRARRVRLLWGLRHESDVHGRPRLEALAAEHPRFSYAIVLSQAGPNWSGARGYVTALLEQEARPEGTYLLAGNGAMIARAEEILTAAGVPAAAILKEVFFTPGQVRVSLAERQARMANRARPGSVVVGLALHSGARAEEIRLAIVTALAQGALPLATVRNLAAPAKASDEPGLRAAAETLGVPIEFYLPAEVDQETLAAGTKSTCEALAYLSAGGRTGLVPKYKTAAVTVAVGAVRPEG
ncbi:MAG: cobalamin biosynthesis protein [Candidatus Rokuibacteriota bacterium]